MPSVTPVATPHSASTALAALIELDHDHQVQQALCADLERMADELPAIQPPAKVRRIAERIEAVPATHFARAEFLLGSLPAECRPSDIELHRVAEMHAIDSVHADDLVGALWEYLARRPGLASGQLAYMLRCFFDGCRRAIAFKEALLARARAINPDWRCDPGRPG